MKYIDADLLKSKLKDVATEFKKGNYYLDNSEQAVGYENALIDFEQIIDSLQQEMPDKETILRICKLHKAWSIMAPWENVEDFVMTNWNSENID